MSKQKSYWDGYIIPDFNFSPFARGAHILDVGCGSGEQLAAAEAKGCTGVGVEPSLKEEERPLSEAVRIIRGTAEHLPFGEATFDGALCKVVTPYTDERKCIAEIARVLRPGGRVVFCHHGLGYFLRYILRPPKWKNAIYGVRTVVNTIVYRLTGRRLPGLFGDTIYQSSTVLRRYYAREGLVVCEAPASRRFCGAPVFIYEVLERRPVPSKSRLV